MDYIPYLNWGMNNFEDVLDAIINFKNGGWWVRKIDFKDGFYREITNGPYEEKKAIKLAKEWNDFFVYKDLTTAKAYSFVDLICYQHSYYKNLNQHLYPEYIWRAPSGSELLCLLNYKKEEKVLMIKKDKEDYNYQKFKLYVLDNGLKLINIEGYQIFYKEGDSVAYEQGKKLENLVKDFKDYPLQIIWLYNKAMDNNIKEGSEPMLIPQYIKDFKEKNKIYTLDFFKDLKNNNNNKKKERIEKLIEKLKNEKKIFTLPNIVSYKLPLLYHKKDYHVKNLLISCGKSTDLPDQRYNKSNDLPDLRSNNDLIIEIKEDKYFIQLIIPQVSMAKIKFNISYDKESYIFNDKLISLMLYISKSLLVEEVILVDNLKEGCDGLELYTNIIRFLAEEISIYDEMGFKEENREKRIEIIEKYKTKIISQKEDDLFYDKTFGDLSIQYLKGYREYKFVCQILNKMCKDIYKELSPCCLEYLIKLKDFSFYQLIEKLK